MALRIPQILSTGDAMPVDCPGAAAIAFLPVMSARHSFRIKALLDDQMCSANLRRQKRDDRDPFSARALIDRVWGRRHREPSRTCMLNSHYVCNLPKLYAHNVVLHADILC
jgi:hypothetical protein